MTSVSYHINQYEQKGYDLKLMVFVLHFYCYQLNHHYSKDQNLPSILLIPTC